MYDDMSRPEGGSQTTKVHRPDLAVGVHDAFVVNAIDDSFTSGGDDIDPGHVVAGRHIAFTPPAPDVDWALWLERDGSDSAK